MVGGARPPLGEQPLETDPRLGDGVQVAVEADRLRAGHLHVDFEMVVEVGAHAGQGMDGPDVRGLEEGRIADPRPLEDGRRIDGAGREHDLAARPQAMGATTAGDGEAHRPAVRDLEPVDEGAAPEGQIRAAQGRAEIGVGGRPATPLPDRHLHRPEALLAVAVVVLGPAVAGLDPGLDEGARQGIGEPAAGDVQGAVRSPPPRFAAVGVLHAPEIGKHVRETPAGGAHRLPGVEIATVAAHVDHAVDGGGATDHLAAGTLQTAAAERRLRLRPVAPVVAAHVHGIGKGSRHLNERSEIRAAVFEQQHAHRGILAQPVGQHAAGAAGADDDVVRLRIGIARHSMHPRRPRLPRLLRRRPARRVTQATSS